MNNNQCNYTPLSFDEVNKAVCEDAKPAIKSIYLRQLPNGNYQAQEHGSDKWVDVQITNEGGNFIVKY